MKLKKTAKTKTQKIEKNSPCEIKNEGLEQAVAEIKKLGKDLASKLEIVKGKFQELDDKTKKQVVAGVAGAVALLAGLLLTKKITRKKK